MPEKDYISKIHLALKENLDGFDKDENTFREAIKDSGYRANVFRALKENLDGFDRTEDDFNTQIGKPLKKKESGIPYGQDFKTIGERLVSSVAPTSGSVSSSASAKNHKIELPKHDPVARISLYENTLNAVNSRFNQNLDMLNIAKDHGDQQAVDQLLPQLHQDGEKAALLKKGIEGQKIIAQQQEPDSYGNNLLIGIKSAAGTLAMAPQGIKESVQILGRDAATKMGLDPVKYDAIIDSYNKAVGVTGSSEELAKVGVDLIRESQKSSQEKNINAEYGGSPWEALKKGDVTSMVDLVAKAFTQSLPTSALYLNPATTALASAGMVGNEIQDAKEEGREVNSGTVLAGTIKAGLELATERMFGAGKSTRELIKSLGKEGAEKVVKEAAEGVVKESLKKKLGKTYSEEAIGETVNQIGSNAVDKYINGKDISLGQGIEDAAIVGLFGGITQGTGTVVLKHAIDNKQIAKAEEQKAKSVQMMDEAAHQQDPVVAQTMEEQAQKLHSDADAIIEQQNEIGDNASPETVDKIKENNAKIEDLNQALQSDITSENKQILSEQLDILQIENEGLIEHATKEATEKVKNESEKQTETPTDLPEGTPETDPALLNGQVDTKEGETGVARNDAVSGNEVNEQVDLSDENADFSFLKTLTDKDLDKRQSIIEKQQDMLGKAIVKDGINDRTDKSIKRFRIQLDKIAEERSRRLDGGKRLTAEEIASIGDTTKNGEEQTETEGDNQGHEDVLNSQSSPEIEKESTATLTPEEKTNLEKVSTETGENFRVVQNIYKKYGEGKPLTEITPEDFKKAQEARVNAKINKQEEETGVTHAETKELRKEFGFPEYERSERKQTALEKTANDHIKEGYNINTLIDKMNDGELPSDVEQIIMKEYIASLSDRVEKDPSDANIMDLRRAVEASDKIGGTEVARSLAARRGLKVRGDTLADYFMTEIDLNDGIELTENQKRLVENEYAEIKKANEEYEAKINKLQEENIALKTEGVVNKAKRGTKTTSIKKTHEEYATERKLIIEDMREKLKRARTELNASIIPYVKELTIVAPGVAKMVQSYFSEGVHNLGDIVDAIHATLKDHIPEITKDDVNALIAGEYNGKKPTRKEDARKAFELKQEAKLVLKLEKLQAGKEPTKDKAIIERKKEIRDLSKQIKQHDLTKLSAYKNRIKTEIQKIEDRLKEGKYEAEPKPNPIVLDADALKLKDKLIRLKQDRDLRVLKAQYANRTKLQKVADAALEVANVPRTIMSSMDFSAPLRQGLLFSTSHPIVAGRAFGQMFKHAFSQKSFDRWFHDVRNDPRYSTAEKSGLYIADPHDPRLSAKEEVFMNNLAEKLPIIGPLIKGSERAYVTFLNKMRWDMFNMFADIEESKGKTIHNSPKIYKGWATYINNSTGRGKLGIFERSAPILNSTFFAPRLVAANLNFLNPVYYAKLPKQVRVQALKDALKFVTLGLSVLGLANLGGASVDDDPRSTDFGKIKIGNTRWDIWGGKQQYVRFLTQFLSGQTKSSKTGKMSTLNGKGPFGRTRGNVATTFFRAKLAPLPSMAVDFMTGKTIPGEDVTINDEALTHLTPMIANDIKEAYKEMGPSSLLKVGLPASLGVGVSTYKNKDDKYLK